LAVSQEINDHLPDGAGKVVLAGDIELLSDGTTKVASPADAWEWRRTKQPSGWANGGSPITKEAHSEGGSNPLTGSIGREGVQLE
jgi:hypothetical protein